MGERVLAEFNQATVEAETKAYMSTRQRPAVWCPEKCNGLQVKCEARCIYVGRFRSITDERRGEVTERRGGPLTELGPTCDRQLD